MGYGVLTWPCRQNPGRKPAFSRRAVARTRRRSPGEQDSTAGPGTLVSRLRGRVARRWGERVADERDCDRVCAGSGVVGSRPAANDQRAAADRAKAAADREEAAHERARLLRHRRELSENLRLAATDELTGAWTRRFGLEEVGRELERAGRTGGSLVLAFVDVDGLKKVNDSRGHLAGDALLQLVGRSLRASVRPYDVVVRYGGDELLCAMPNLRRPRREHASSRSWQPCGRPAPDTRSRSALPRPSPATASKT